MRSTTAVRAVLLALLACLCAAACSAGPPSQLTRRAAPPDAVADPARPCSREAPAAPVAAAPAPAGLAATFDKVANRITVTGGTDVALPAIAQAVGDPTALRETAPGEWLLGASLEVERGASVRIDAPAVRWLQLASSGGHFVTVKAVGGGVAVTGTCVTSWDPAAARADTDIADGRPFLLARDGASMTVDRAELRFLGYGEVESYGLSWRTEGTTGRITGSLVSNLFYGVYSFQVGGLVVQGNEISDSVLYGIDPHTGSHDMTIAGNTVHDNGKHGIILAEDCVDSVIRDNVVYRNQHHGIVMYLRSNRNVIENNDSFANAVQGININESAGNAIRDNRVYDNAESGISVGQTAQDNVIEHNQLRGNKQDGVRLVSEAAGTVVRGNTIGENARYGVYVDSDGAFEVTTNTVFGSRTGIMLKGTTVKPAHDNHIYENRDQDVRIG